MAKFVKETLSDDVSNSQSKFTELSVVNSGLRGKYARSLLRHWFRIWNPRTLCL